MQGQLGITGIILSLSCIAHSAAAQNKQATLARTYASIPQILTVHDIINFIAQDTQISYVVKTSCRQATKNLEKIYRIAHEYRTFENTIAAFNYIIATFQVNRMRIWLLNYLTTDNSVHSACRKALAFMHEFELDHFFHNSNIYSSCMNYIERDQKERLTPEQQYTIEKIMREFRVHGFPSSVRVQEELSKLAKQLKKLLSRFTRNIATDIPQLIISSYDLAGLPTEFVHRLEKKSEHEFILTLDAYNYRFASAHSGLESTRKRIWRDIVNRAYPQNREILKQIISIRDKIARLSGFTSFAQLDLYTQMARTPKQVEKFLARLQEPIKNKVDNELVLLQKIMPLPIAPWNLNWAERIYNKKYSGVSEKTFSAYFPFKQSIRNICNLFGSFWGIRFVPLKQHNNQLSRFLIFAVYKDNTLLGHILLDLFSTKKKFLYARKVTLVPTFYYNNQRYPALILIQLNLVMPEPNKPALLKPYELTRIAHEWGHAIHALLGCTELPSNSGTAVPRDVAELMPKLCEELIWYPRFLQKISSHYTTKKQMPDALLHKLLSIYRNNKGQLLQKQLYDAQLALAFYKTGTPKNLDQISRDLFQSIITYTFYNPDYHGYASFQHVGIYGARYYSYLWARALAQKVFEKFKSTDFSHELFSKFSADILAQGGGADPSRQLARFFRK